MSVVYVSEKEFQAQLAEADRVVSQYAFISLATGLVPVPLVELLAAGGLQVKMVSRLAEVFKTPFAGNVVRALVGVMIGWVLGKIVARPLTAVLSAIPVLGPLAGPIGAGALTAAGTYAIGKVFTEHFAAGGTILTLEPEKVRDYFEAQFEAGLNQARQRVQP